MQQMKHVGFCAGDYFKRMDKDFINGLEYCVDNDSSKWGTESRGIPIVSPETLLKEDKTKILISVYSPAYFNEISEQLKEMGFAEGVHYELETPGKLWVGSHKIILNAALLTWWGPIDGDYYEFGVYDGTSLIDAFKTISAADRFCNSRWPEWKRGIPRFRCFCLDSFEGLPKPAGIDVDGVFSKGDFKCDEDTFIGNLQSAGVNLDRVEIIKGWYSDLNRQTLEKNQMKTARIIHIDCDLYESTRDALAFCTYLITDGTLVIFDEWFLFSGHPYKGEQQAFREWQTANPNFICTEYMREFPFRNSFIVNIK